MFANGGREAGSERRAKSVKNERSYIGRWNAERKKQSDAN
jgi:hypothetical protein